MAIKLDDSNEKWLVTHRKEALKKRGWKGSVEDWQDARELLKKDPLAMKPPITSLADAKKKHKK